MTNEPVVIPLSGRIDSTNAADVEKKVFKRLEGCGAAPIVLDASGLGYISSAGLRVLLRVKKTHPDLAITGVSSEVYEILEMTGFTEMMTVEKAYRVVSVEGCEEIGRGANGTIYRIDRDNVVKVYNNADALADIRHEREMAKTALILGIPTAISYDVVRVGESYGSVFELLNASSFSKILASEPEKFDWCVEEFADMLKKIHATVVPGGKLPNAKDKARKWARFMRDWLPEEAHAKLTSLIEAVPESDHMIHGDYHPKNIMLQDGEVLVIDMDTLSVGDPIFELCSVFNAFLGFSEYDHNVVKEFQGFDRELSERFYYAFLSRYLGTTSQAKLREVTDKARVLGYAHLIGWKIRHGALETEKGRAEVEFRKERLLGLLDTVDTLVFLPNELEAEADRNSLAEVLSFIEEHIEPLGLSEKVRMQLELAAEEIFVNIADYAYAPDHGRAKILVETDVSAGETAITFSDNGKPFDPTKKDTPSVSLPANERTPGGLGIFLARKLMDDISYEYRDGKNILRLKKKV